MVWTYPLTHPNATIAVGGSDTEEMAEVENGPGPIGNIQRSRSRSASRSRSPIIPLVRLELSTDSSESSDEGDSDYQPQLDNVRAPGRRRNRRLRRVPWQPRIPSAWAL
uniref:Uncharacterized protein n=1 Tax=Tetranychus urticae TaxID=32264 RepID=T1K397_TETUR